MLEESLGNITIISRVYHEYSVHCSITSMVLVGVGVVSDFCTCSLYHIHYHSVIVFSQCLAHIINEVLIY